MKRLIVLLVACIAYTACDADRTLFAPDAAAGLWPNPAELTVMSYNVYYGVDLGVLLDESIMLPVRTALVLGQLESTNAPERAAAIARQIAAARPHLVGLQEVARWRIQSPGDFLDADFSVQNPFPNATDVIFDFMDLLLAALAAEGVHYVVASRTTTLDAELPVLRDFACSPCDDLRFTESVAILARSDVPVSNAQNHVFAVNLPIMVSGFMVEITKGWAAVDATVGGVSYRFATTHLEPADVGPGHTIIEPIHQIQQAQAAQLLAWLDGSPFPVVLTGDLNSEPRGTSTNTYAMVRQAGYVDTWLVGPPRGDGFTANQDAQLMNAESALWHRIDYVLYRDEFTAAGRPFRGSAAARVVGDQQADRTPSGLWPSDHAAVLVTLRVGLAR